MTNVLVAVEKFNFAGASFDGECILVIQKAAAPTMLC